MHTVIIVFHIIASIFLIAVILFQAGRGGGLADTFGGSQLQNLFGTKSKNILSKVTAICAGIFIITCLLLAIISSNKSKSIVDKVRIPDAEKIVFPDVAKKEDVVKDEVEKNVPIVSDKEQGEDIPIVPDKKQEDVQEKAQ